MEVRIIKESRTELEVEIAGEDYTFCNVLQNVLNSNSDVVLASYSIDHPLLSNPRIYIKTKSLPPDGKRKILPLSEIKGLGPKRIAALEKAGIKSANALINASISKLEKKSKISAKVLENYISEAKKLDFGKESAPRAILKDSLTQVTKTFANIGAKFK